VTGVAGFIGMHVAQMLLTRGDTVLGLDNLNDYYDPRSHFLIVLRDRLVSLAGDVPFAVERGRVTAPHS